MASRELDLQKLTVPALKAELAERGLDVSGKKSDLVSRLAEAFNKEEASVLQSGENNETTDEGTEGQDETNAMHEDMNEDTEIRDDEPVRNEEDLNGEGVNNDNIETEADDVVNEESVVNAGEDQFNQEPEYTTEDAAGEVTYEDNYAEQNEAEQNEAEQNEAEQNEADQNEADPNEADQNDVEQTETDQNDMYTEQNEAYVEQHDDEINEGCDDPGVQEEYDESTSKNDNEEGGTVAGDENQDVIVLDSHCELDGAANTETSESATETPNKNEKINLSKASDKKEKLKQPLPSARISVPSVKEYRQEKSVAQRMHMVLLYPVTFEDLSKPVVTEQIQKCLHVNVRIGRASLQRTLYGHCALEFGTLDETEKAFKALVGFSETAKVHQMTENDTFIGDVRRALDGDKFVEEYNSGDTAEDRTLYVCKLPRNVTEEQLTQLFPEATCVLLPRGRFGQNNEPKGHAYIEFETREKAKEVADSSANLKLDSTVIATRILFTDKHIAEKHEDRKQKALKHDKRTPNRPKVGSNNNGSGRGMRTDRKTGGVTRPGNSGKKPLLARQDDLRNRISKKSPAGNDLQRGGMRRSGPISNIRRGTNRSQFAPTPLMSVNFQSSFGAGRSPPFQRSLNTQMSSGQQFRSEQSIDTMRFGLSSDLMQQASRPLLSTPSAWSSDTDMRDMLSGSRDTMMMNRGRQESSFSSGTEFSHLRSPQSQIYSDRRIISDVSSANRMGSAIRPADNMHFGRGLSDQVSVMGRMGPSSMQYEDRREAVVDEAIRAVQRQQVGPAPEVYMDSGRGSGIKRQVIMRTNQGGNNASSSLMNRDSYGGKQSGFGLNPRGNMPMRAASQQAVDFTRDDFEPYGQGFQTNAPKRRRY